MTMLLIVIITILALYGYNGVAQPVNNTDSVRVDTTLIDSTKTVSRADLVSIKKVTTQWKQITTWKEKAAITINILIICVFVLLLIWVYVSIKLSKIKKRFFSKVNELNNNLEKQKNEYFKLKDEVYNHLERENIKVPQLKVQEEYQIGELENTYKKIESTEDQPSKPIIKDFADYLSAGRDNADFFILCADKTGAPFCVEYHKEDRSDSGVLKLLTDINNLRTMDKGFRKTMIDMDSSNTTIAYATNYNIVSYGSVSFDDGVWKIKNKIKIKLIK